MSDESKSPEAGANAATAARGVQVALFAAQTQAEANAHAAVAAVQAEVDARRAGRAEAEARQATDAAVASRQANDAAATAAAAATPAATANPPSMPAASGGVVSTADVRHWQNQVSSEFSRMDTEILGVKSSLDNVLLSVASLRDAVAGGASKTADVEVLIQQFVDNFADREPSVRDGGDARERHVQKSQLTDDTALWKKMSSRKHWLLRGRLPPNLGESAADIQSFVGESIDVTAGVAAQLRDVSNFDVSMYGPRADRPVDHLVFVADRLDLLRQALMAVLTVGLSADVADDRACLDRLAPVDVSFTSAAAGLRRHTLSSILLRYGSASRAVMSDMVNEDLRLWVNDLMRFAQQVRPLTVPPQFNAVFNAPPVPAFGRTRNLCSSGGEVLKIVEALQFLRDSSDGAPKRGQSLAPAKTGPARKKSAALCGMFASTGLCRYSDCKFVHANTPANSSSPAALLGGGSASPAGGTRGGAAAQASGMRALVLRPDGGRGGAGGGGGSGSG